MNSAHGYFFFDLLPVLVPGLITSCNTAAATASPACSILPLSGKSAMNVGLVRSIPCCSSAEARSVCVNSDFRSDRKGNEGQGSEADSISSASIARVYLTYTCYACCMFCCLVTTHTATLFLALTRLSEFVESTRISQHISEESLCSKGDETNADSDRVAGNSRRNSRSR